MQPNKPFIIAFGYEARSGKGECASYLGRKNENKKVLVTSFAKALRFEIHQALQGIASRMFCSPREAMQLLCEQVGVEYDPFAQPDELNPHGKQRRLQQWWGTEYRRAECPTYWVDKVRSEIDAVNPDIVLIDDLRFRNEAAWLVDNGGFTVKVIRPGDHRLSGDAAKHVSESELIEHPFDYTIINDGDIHLLHQRAQRCFDDLYINHNDK